MTGIWVDTDFGFDDLWALLLLRHLNCPVAGVSLVAGNTPLAQVAANATAAKAVYGFNWPLWQGAARPLVRDPETAERILGPTGMRTRGRQLDPAGLDLPPPGALDAMQAWLDADFGTNPGTDPSTAPDTDPGARHQILALGPLTNIALLLRSRADLASRVTRLVWMGGSAGAGNHTPAAEYNALADAEALALVVASGVPFDIVDLTFCRQVTFGPDDLPQIDPLTGDLLGGYLDIALERGRAGMAIYDPLAALAIATPASIPFQPCAIHVETGANADYGATRVTPADASHVRISHGAPEGQARTCLSALEGDAIHGPRH